MSEVTGTITTMTTPSATTPTASTAVPGPVEPAKRVRGKNKKKRYRHKGPTAVIPLQLDVTGGAQRRVETLFSAVYTLQRALIRDAASGCTQFWLEDTARQEQKWSDVLATHRVDAAGLADRAKTHVEDSVWLGDHLSKAVVLHASARVAETVKRHVFGDSNGKRSGAPKVGSWFDFTTIAGRARSHTKPGDVWETFRLAGSLQGHVDTYRHPGLPADVVTVDDVLKLPAGVSVLSQPKQLPAPTAPFINGKRSWATYDGPLVVVYTLKGRDDVVLPVRLPSGSGSWAYLNHFLADREPWHKIDVVRVRDRRAPGGWRYNAHLLTQQAGYVSESTKTRRANVPTGRIAGVDGNVSKLAAVSFHPGRTSTIAADYITVTETDKAKADAAALRARRQQRALDRSRRGANPDQYELSFRQTTRAQRRAEAGLPERHVQVRKGPRKANKAGVPVQAYRKDTLTDTYRQTRATHAQESRSASQAKHARATATAQQLITGHGANVVTEHVNMAGWARLWGKALSLFAPGMLMAALEKEAQACGGTVLRAGTRKTALSQHCLCQTRVPKTLADRHHGCPSCGLTGDRDLVAAAGAACVTLSNPSVPSTARRNTTLATILLQQVEAGQQKVLTRSTDPTRHTSDTGVKRGTASTPVVLLPAKPPVTRPTPAIIRVGRELTDVMLT